jgi:hypothetical protein
MEPIKSLEILVTLLSRTPMTPAEQVGAQQCVETIKKALEPKAEDKSGQTTPE